MSAFTLPPAAAYWLAFAAVVSSLVSIAASQTLLGLAAAALLAARSDWRFPPLWLPLALFVGWTFVSLAFSPDPQAGLPQIRKFYVFLTLWTVYSSFRTAGQVRRLTIALAAAAVASGILGMVQFAVKWQEARELGTPFYLYYVGERITGFMSHWQTFGGGLMLVLVTFSAFLLFGQWKNPRLRALGFAAAGVIGAAIVLGFTRNIWLGSFVGGLYLLWFWKRKLILAVPIALTLLIAFGPEPIRARFTSLFRPHGDVDSNQHRIVTFRTGLRMIQASPIVGLGPEQVGAQFDRFVPADVPRPLPTGWYGHLHNIYLQYAAERGIPALLCLLWFLLTALTDFVRARNHHWFLHGAVAAILALMASGFFELNLGDSEVLTLFLAIVASGYAVRDALESEFQRA